MKHAIRETSDNNSCSDAAAKIPFTLMILDPNKLLLRKSEDACTFYKSGNKHTMTANIRLLLTFKNRGGWWCEGDEGSRSLPHCSSTLLFHLASLYSWSFSEQHGQRKKRLGLEDVSLLRLYKWQKRCSMAVIQVLLHSKKNWWAKTIACLSNFAAHRAISLSINNWYIFTPHLPPSNSKYTSIIIYYLNM